MKFIKLAITAVALACAAVPAYAQNTLQDILSGGVLKEVKRNSASNIIREACSVTGNDLNWLNTLWVPKLRKAG